MRDELEHVVVATLGRPGAARGGDPRGQDRQVVVVAEQVGQRVRVLGERLEGARPRVAQQACLVPEVLRALAPLVQALVGRLRVRGGHRVAPAAVGAHRAVPQRVGVQALQRPVGHRVGRGPERHDDVGERGPRGAATARAGDLGADVREALLGQPADVPLGQVVDRGREHVRVAAVRQAPPGVAQLVVDPAVGIAVEARAREAQERAGLLQVLPGSVHGLDGVVVVLVAQARQGVVELLPRGPAGWSRRGPRRSPGDTASASLGHLWLFPAGRAGVRGDGQGRPLMDDRIRETPRAGGHRARRLIEMPSSTCATVSQASTRGLEGLEDVLPADHDHRVDAVGEERRDGVARDPVALVLQAVDLDEEGAELGARAQRAQRERDLLAAADEDLGELRRPAPSAPRRRRARRRPRSARRSRRRRRARWRAGSRRRRRRAEPARPRGAGG